MQWKFLSSHQFSDPKEVARALLKHRGVEQKDFKEFFSPRSPLELSYTEVGLDQTQLDLATQRIKTAIQNQEDVVIFGDYDADGVCATTVLWEAIAELGLEARVFIPDRLKHGYGMSDRSLSALLNEKKPNLIITVDNGIVAHTAVQSLVDQGVDVIVTDHHAPELNSKLENSKFQKKSQSTIHYSEFNFPNAHSIVHTTQLCGTTVAWFLAKSLGAESIKNSLDLCGIATIADQMPLLKANRSFATHGIEAMRNTNRTALLELYTLANIAPQDIDARSVNFVIAPRINAMGRLSSAVDAFHALTHADIDEVRRLVNLLHTTNTERQELTWETVEHAKSQADLWKDEHIIVLASETYHEGVIGLIAGKMVEEFSKPAIVMSVGKTFVKASARSVAGINIVDFIRNVREDLLEVGGHPMAAGFGLLPEKVELVQQKLQANAKKLIHPESLIQSLTIELELSPEVISTEFVQLLQKFAPFGNANAEPVFAFSKMRIIQSRVIGREGKHVKLLLRSEHAEKSAPPLECLAFGWGSKADQLFVGSMIDVAGTLQLNQWNGNTSIQLILKDARKAQS